MESALVRAFNSYFQENNISALAYRLYQSQYSRGQMIDFIVDSKDPRYYLGIEAKSMDASKVKTFNFKARFDSAKAGEAKSKHQLEREMAYCQLTGRKGILAIECRYGTGRPRECYFLSLEDVYKMWKSGKKSLKLKEIIEYPKIIRTKGKYIISDSVF